MVADAVDEEVAEAGLRDHVARGLVHLAEGGARAHRRDCGKLGLQNDVVDLALALGEAAIHGIGARDVGGVARELRTRVEHHHIAGHEGRIVGAVVEHRAVHPGARDRAVGRAARAVAAVGVFGSLLDLELGDAGADRREHGLVAFCRDVDGALHERLLGGALHRTQSSNDLGAVVDRARRDARGDFAIDRQVGRDRRGVRGEGVQARQALGALGAVQHPAGERVGAEDRRDAVAALERARDLLAQAVPLLEFGVEGLEEELYAPVRDRMSGIEQQHRTRFIRDASEPFEVRMRTEVAEVAALLVPCEDHGHARAECLHDAFASCGVLGDGDRRGSGLRAGAGGAGSPGRRRALGHGPMVDARRRVPSLAEDPPWQATRCPAA